MKVFNTLIISMLLVGGINFATCNQARADEFPQSASQKIISNEIKRKLTFPEELIGNSVNERVVIEFKINQEKKIEIVGIETDNLLLKSHVYKQMSLMVVPESENLTGRVLQISVLFYNDVQ